MTTDNIKKHKTKTATVIVGALLAGLVLLSPTAIMPEVNAQNANIASNYCLQEAEKTLRSKVINVDFNPAKEAVTNSTEFKSMTSGYKAVFDSINNSWTMQADCSIKWESINLIYSLSDSQGQVVKNAEFSLNPQTLQIIKSWEYVPSSTSVRIPAPLANVVTLPPPLKQTQSGISPTNSTCNTGLHLIIKSEDGSPACVTSQTANILIERGWGHLP